MAAVDDRLTLSPNTSCTSSAKLSLTQRTQDNLVYSVSVLSGHKLPVHI